jgi:transposase-like protein
MKKWVIAYYLYLADSLGVSSYVLAKHCNVTQTTACNMLRRIRETFRQENEKQIFGLIEGSAVQSDETYLKGKNKNKHGNKKTVNGQGRSKNPATVPVMGIVDKATGKAKMFKVSNTNAQTITPLLLKYVVPGTNVHTDEWKGYKELVKYYHHVSVNHGNKEYANGDANTNRVEGLWSLLKRLVYGRYRKVSDKHTQSYLNEQVYRFNSREVSTFGKFVNCFELTATGYKTLYQLKQGLAA